MPYAKLSEAPANIRELNDVALTLAQVNWIAVREGRWVKRERGRKEMEAERMKVLDRVVDFLRGGGELQEGGLVSPGTRLPLDAIAGEKDQNFKTEDGVRFKRSDYAVRGEANKPTTWKLPLAEGSSGNFTVAQVARAITAMQPGGFRGRRVQLDSGERAEAVRNISAAIGKVGDADQKKNLRERLAKVKGKDLIEAAIEGKVLSLSDIQRGIHHIVSPPTPEVTVAEERAWVRDVFPDGNSGHAILEQGKNLYKAAYTIGEDDTLQLGEITRVTVDYKPVPVATKEFAGGIKVVEGADGEDYWITRTSNAFQDREKEIFSTAALEDYVKQVDEGIPAGVKEFLEERGLPSTDHGELWLWHIPGSRIGKPRWKAMAGRFLVEIGTFDDTPLGRAAKELFREHGEDYRISHSYLYLPEDKESGVYSWLWKFETSPLPAGPEANPWTGIDVIAQEAKEMNEEKKQWLTETFGEELANGILAKADEDSKTLEELGINFKEAEDEEDAGEEGKKQEETIVMDKDSKAFEMLVKAIAEAVPEHLAVNPMFVEMKDGIEKLGERVEAIEKADKPLMVLGRGYRASQEDETKVEVKDLPAGALPQGKHPLDEKYKGRQA